MQALGGAKNHIVVMPDAVVKPVSGILGSAFGNAGQRCLAGSVVMVVGDAETRLRDALRRPPTACASASGAKRASRWVRSS